MEQTPLGRCQAIVDELTRNSLHARGLIESMCLLKLEADLFQERNEALVREMDRFVEEFEVMCQLCRDTYTTLYLKMYTALDPPSTKSQNTKLKASSVPIDPTSALNIVQNNVEMTIPLYNDNETLTKFPLSELSKVPQIVEKTASLESYYQAQCLTVHTYQESYARLVSASERLSLERMQVSQDIYQVREHLEVFSQPSMEQAVLALEVALDQLDASVGKCAKERCEEVGHCRLYRDNVSSKFNVAARLKENMLRTYYLSTLHKRREGVAPAF